MKKLITVLLVIAILIPGIALACENVPVLTAKSTSSCDVMFDDPAWWPLTEDHILAGIKDYGEKLEREGVQHVSGMYVAGPIEHGWMRTKKEIRVTNVNGKTIGLTLLTNTTITIYGEYVELAKEVVHELFGEDVELSQNSIVAGAIWRNYDYASFIFHPSYSDRFEIGYATMNNGEDRTPVYLGHFGDDLRFGFACGWWIPAPESKSNVTNNAVVETNASASSISNNGNGNNIDNSGDGCYRNNLVIQVNIGSWVKNCIKFLKECAE